MGYGRRGAPSPSATPRAADRALAPRSPNATHPNARNPPERPSPNATHPNARTRDPNATRLPIYSRAVSQASTDEPALLEAWRAGDLQAGQILFRSHYGALVRFFRSKAGEAAHELTQATFLACVEARGAIRSAASFRAYLYGVARNILYDHYRGKQRASVVLEFEDVSTEDLSPGLAGVHAAEQELE